MRRMAFSGLVSRLVLPRADLEPEQLSVAHAGGTLTVTFVRSARARRVSLRVDAGRRRIVLTSPMRLSLATAHAFAQAHAGWIAARLRRLPERRPFVDGAEVPYFGQPHVIRHRPDARGTVWREGSEIHVAGRAEHLPRRLRDWLTAELRRELLPLVHAKAASVDRRVKRITIRDNRSRWGSCGPDATMTFSWRLVFAPTEVVDYLVAHEVAHLVHLNHSRRFWALARKLTAGPMDPPHLWLRQNADLLLQYGA
ncbi:MAG: M48 family metallopeptidase [Alphaproteobacteria bacterium]|nr:M48 family metallopeptidase [Alphaproteobacteria bacterium]